VCLEGGLTYPRIFTLLSQDGDPHLAIISKAVGDDLQAGKSLPEALELRKSIFGSFQVEMIRVGEASGQLPRVLRDLSEAEERLFQMQSRIRTLLIGPCFTAFMLAFLLLIVMPLWAFRSYLDFVKEVKLPEDGLLQILLGFIRFTQTPYWWGGLLALAGSMAFFYTNPARREILASSLLKALAHLPLLGPRIRPLYGTQKSWEVLVAVIEAITLSGSFRRVGYCWLCLVSSRFAHSLGLQLQVGVGVLDAVESSLRVTGSPLVEARKRFIVSDLKQGSSLRDSLLRSEFFPSLLVETIGVGEESGQAPLLCQHLGTLYQGEFEHQLEVAVNLLQPAMMIFVGLVVGLFAAIMIVPQARAIEALASGL